MATITVENNANGTTTPPIDAPPSSETRLDALGAAMKQHPLLSIGLGIVVGYLLARLIDRG